MNIEIKEVLTSKEWAQLGDSYVNFLYSFAKTNATGIPTGKRVNDKILMEIARKSGIKNFLPKRTSRGRVADAVEALIVFAWYNKIMTFHEMIARMISNNESGLKGLNQIVEEILDKISNKNLKFKEKIDKQTILHLSSGVKVK